MKLKPIAPVILSTLIAISAGCSEKNASSVTTEGSTAATTTAVTTDNTAGTTTVVTTTTAETTTIAEETEPPFVDVIHGKALDIIAPKIIELPTSSDFDVFSDKNGLLKAQTMFYNDVFLHDLDNTVAYGVGYGSVDEDGNLFGKLIESPEDVPCLYYVEYDFDYDGETEYIVFLYYYSKGALEFDIGKTMYYLDGDAEPCKIEGIKKLGEPFTAYDYGDKICIDAVGYRYGTLTTFEDGKADLLIGAWSLSYDERGFLVSESPGNYYEPIIIYTADHNFIKIGWEEISSLEFEEFIDHNETLEKKLTENNISISDIEHVYTIGFLSFLLVTNSTSTYVSVDDNWYGVIGGTEEEYTHGIDLNKLNIVNRE